MAAIFSALKSVAKIAVPLAWSIGKPLIDAGVNAISSMDMANGAFAMPNGIGANLNGFGANVFGILGSMDDPISERDRKLL